MWANCSNSYAATFPNIRIFRGLVSREAAVTLLGGLFYCFFLEAEEIDIVLADELHNFPIRLQLEDELSSPRLRISLGIVDRDFDFQAVVINTADPLHNVQIL